MIQEIKLSTEADKMLINLINHLLLKITTLLYFKRIRNKSKATETATRSDGWCDIC